jgi:hypothetical protein
VRRVSQPLLSKNLYEECVPLFVGWSRGPYEVREFLGDVTLLPLPRRYGDEAQLNGQPAASSVSQLILHLRDRNVVAGVTIYDNSGAESSQDMTTALYAIADLFSSRIAAA